MKKTVRARKGSPLETALLAALAEMRKVTLTDKITPADLRAPTETERVIEILLAITAEFRAAFHRGMN